MRILVADQNALLLAGIARAFGRHCDIVVATRRDECAAHLEEHKFDVVVACEKLQDYTGLELLGDVTALSPRTLRIFSARPEALKRLGARLDFFGLLGTLSYPIEARKLLVALKVARSKLAHGSSGPAALPKPPKPQVRHVVLEDSANRGPSGVPTGHGGSTVPAQVGVPHRAGSAAPMTSNPAGAAGRLGANASDVRVVDSAAWVARPPQVAGDDSGSTPIGAPSPDVGVDAGDASAGSAGRKASARKAASASPRTAESSLEVSFDEMPGAIAVARVKQEAAASPGVGVAEPRAAGASVERASRQDVKAESPLGTSPLPRLQSAPKSAAPAGSRPRSLVKEACNDPDIDAPLPVQTYGAANEPLYDNEPGKGGVRASSASRRPAGDVTTAAAPVDANSETRAHGSVETPGALDASDSRGASNARVTRDASGASGASGAHGASSERATAGRDADQSTRGTEGTPKGRAEPAARGGAGAKPAGASGGAKNSAAKGPKVRKAAVPTVAQREAFQRALARRNAARLGGGFDEGSLGSGAEAHDVAAGDFGRAPGGEAQPKDARAAGAHGTATHSAERSTPFISTQSLADLAKMATKKRPLKELNRGTSLPRRRVLVYGSGVAAALLAVVIFQLTKATHSGGHGHNQQVQESSTHLFGPTSTPGTDGTGGTPQIFTPTPPQADATTSSLPRPQHFDPNTAPPDPPPPPAVEHPGPVEPPSMAHNGPPMGMRGSSEE